MSTMLKWAGGATLAAAACLTLGAVAQAQSSGNDAYIQKLHNDVKAKGQTEVFMYSNNSRQFGEIYSTFQKKFGVTVKVTDMFGPPLTARLEAEHAAGGPQADIIQSGVSDLIVFYRKGWMAPFVPENAKGLDPALIGPENKWFSFAVVVLGTIVNTNMVKPEDYPKTWADHVKPRWQGKIAMNNPSASSGLSQGLASNLEHKSIDVAWIEKLASLKPIIAPSSNASLQMVASGQMHMSPYVGYNTYNDAKMKGAPLAYMLQQDGYAALPAPAGLAAKAKRPEAAKLLLAWYMTPECQALLTKSGQPGVMPGAPGIPELPEANKFKRQVMSAKYLAEQYEPMLQANKKRFGN